MISHSKNQKTATSIFVRSMVQTSSDSKLQDKEFELSGRFKGSLVDVLIKAHN